MEQIIPATLIQLAASVIVLKLSGYTQSVMGHGKQQWTPANSWQNRPLRTRIFKREYLNTVRDGVITYARKHLRTARVHKTVLGRNPRRVL
jgi:hypothetical protein